MSKTLLNELNAFNLAAGLEPVAKWSKDLADALQAFRDAAPVDVSDVPVIEAPVAPVVIEADDRPWTESRKGNRVTKNGVSAPAVGTKGGDAWSLFDAQRAMGIADTASIVSAGVAAGQNRGQLRTELSTWRRFHGIARPPRAAKAPVVVETSAE